MRLPQTIVLPLAPAEISRLLACCDPATAMGRRDRAIVLTLLDTGVRCSEAAHLDLADWRLPERRLGRSAGIPRVHAHRFRHPFATWAIAHDAREFDVQHLLGQSSPKMVRRYSATYGSA